MPTAPNFPSDDRRPSTMVGDSEPMQRVYEQIRRAAPCDGSVVISGESGTGKELVAAALHELSPRSKGPFIDVNTAAIPQTLVESELFGHVKGSFTGAIGDRIGCFEAADGGTLFIDEIGELELSSQAKLLRTLETHRVRRVGGCEDHLIDARVVAATNRRLEEMITEGTFRRDLYYRLNVITIFLPPLRDRRTDIPLLVTHFLQQIAARMGRDVPTVDSALMDFLVNHAWPGNVRQLRNCLESMVVMSANGRLTQDDLPRRLFLLMEPNQRVQIPVDLSLDDLERIAIEQALTYFNDDRIRAAKSLGISVRTLQRKLRQWSHPRPSGVRVVPR